jgi:integrase
MAGRPTLRIGSHGKISRKHLGDGVWLARCRYRDGDGVTRIVERRGPFGDQYGKLAEDALIEALGARRAPAAGGEVTLDTKLTVLVDRHIDRLEEDGRAATTIDTYRAAAGKLAKLIDGVRVGEATPARVDAALRSMRTGHGAGMARHARVILRGGLQLAVMATVLGSNPVRDVSPITSKDRPKGARALTGDELRELLAKLRASDFCQKYDLADPITMLIATGLRRSELLGLLWSNYEQDAARISVTGKVARVTGKGLIRFSQTKTAAGARTLALPKFAVDMLAARRTLPYLGEQQMIFPSTAGTWRDPSNFGRDWRTVRDSLGVPDVSSHSFRRSLATLIDDGGLSARIGADHLGHSRPSMTMDKYMTRGRVHTSVADLLDRTINDE